MGDVQHTKAGIENLNSGKKDFHFLGLPTKNHYLLALRRGDVVRSQYIFAHLYIEPKNEESALKSSQIYVAVNVSKTLGNAVLRNRIKRRLREASRGFFLKMFAEHYLPNNANWHLLLRARDATLAEMPCQDLQNELADILKQLNPLRKIKKSLQAKSKKLSPTK